MAAEASLRERTISESSEEFSDVADECDELDEDGEDSDGLPDVAGVDEAPPRKSTPIENLPATNRADINHPQRAVSPSFDSRKVPPPPVMYCSACGDSCVSMEAFHLHVMEKHRPPSPPNRALLKSSPAAESPAKMAPSNIQPDVGRYFTTRTLFNWFV